MSNFIINRLRKQRFYTSKLAGFERNEEEPGLLFQVLLVNS